MPSGTIASVCGIQSLQMGVFGGIIVGLGVAALHNRFYKIELPSALSFFGGTRFVPIISTIVYLFVGIAMYFIWPTVQGGIYALGGLVTGTGYFGTLIFGLIKRALIPFGLHHVFYMPFWQTGVGGTMEVAGQLVEGGQNIFFAQLADSANITHFSADATRYFSGEFIFMIFGLPGAALAMYHCAKPEKKKQAGGLLLSAALACMLTGITEPLEFSFLFVAPALFAVQVYGRQLVYFDNAATSQRLDSVLKMQDEWARTANANIHRAVHHLADQATEHYETAREAVRAFIGAESTSEIIFTSGTTASINLVTAALLRGFV